MPKITIAELMSGERKAQYNVGGDSLLVSLKVIGQHIYQLPESSGLPLKGDTLTFAFSNTALPVNVYAGFEGTIAFFLRARYSYYKTGFWRGGMPPFAFGEKTYRMAFDYSLPSDAANPTDLTIQQGVGSIVDDPDVEGDDDYTIELNQWNPDIGMAKGPNYVRINPSLTASQAGKSITLSGGADLGVDVQFSTSSSISPPLPSSQNGIARGGFKIPIHTQLNPVSIPDNKPPQSFALDMAVTLSYKSDGDFAFTEAMESTLLAWVTNINNKYPLSVAKVLRKGGLMVYVDGYATITGTPAFNQKLSDLRAGPVAKYVATQLAVPANQVSRKPFGSQKAKAQWDFDGKGNARQGPRDEDRVVVVWIDADEAWKAVLAP